MQNYEVMFALQDAMTGRRSVEPVNVEAENVVLTSDWVEFTTGGSKELKMTVAAFPRDKVFGLRKVDRGS